MSKILITGSAGFIGYHLSKRLLERGDIVVGVDNINDYYDVNLKFARLSALGISEQAQEWHCKVQSNKYENHTFYRCNIENQEFIFKLFEEEKFDIVCNLAAQAGVRYSIENPQTYISSNILGFFNILEASRHHDIKHLLYASSSSVYGKNNKMPLSTKDKVDEPISLYAATKKSNELMAHTYSHLFEIPTTGLRFFTVYGPWGRPDMALFLFTKSILENRPIKVFNKGDMFRDFTYIDDIIEGVVRLLDMHTLNLSNKSHYKIYNIGNSRPVNLMKFIEAVESCLHKVSVKEYLPIQSGDVLRTEADVSDLIRDTGYKPETNIMKGVSEFTKWYKKYYKVN